MLERCGNADPTEHSGEGEGALVGYVTQQNGGRTPGSEDDEIVRKVVHCSAAEAEDWWSGMGESISNFFPSFLPRAYSLEGGSSPEDVGRKEVSE